MIEPSKTITCVECGGTAHLLSYLPSDEELQSGYPLAYVCADCNHRHDLIWEPEDDD